MQQEKAHTCVGASISFLLRWLLLLNWRFFRIHQVKSETLFSICLYNSFTSLAVVVFCLYCKISQFTGHKQIVISYIKLSFKTYRHYTGMSNRLIYKEKCPNPTVKIQRLEHTTTNHKWWNIIRDRTFLP